jgi:hypothetical protein
MRRNLIALFLLIAWFSNSSVKGQTPENWDFPEKYDSLVVFLADSLDDILDVNIKVKEKRIGTTMAMRPSFFSFFKKPEKRTYVLCINNRADFSGVLFRDVPHEARVGLLAHELMHVRDYQSRGFGGLVERGWQYLSKRGKHTFEHEIDQMVIDAGFGFFLYYWSSYVLDESDVDEKYREFKRRVYMKPKTILSELNKLGELEVM